MLGTDGRMDGWMDGQTDGRTDEGTGGLLELLSQLKNLSNQNN